MVNNIDSGNNYAGTEINCIQSSSRDCLVRNKLSQNILSNFNKLAISANYQEIIDLLLSSTKNPDAGWQDTYLPTLLKLVDNPQQFNNHFDNIITRKRYFVSLAKTYFKFYQAKDIAFKLTLFKTTLKKVNGITMWYKLTIQQNKQGKMAISFKTRKKSTIARRNREEKPTVLRSPRDLFLELSKDNKQLLVKRGKFEELSPDQFIIFQKLLQDIGLSTGNFKSILQNNLAVH
jgi:hypothetical protein